MRIRLQRRGNQFTIQAGAPVKLAHHNWPANAGDERSHLRGHRRLFAMRRFSKRPSSPTCASTASKCRSKVTIFDLTSRNSRTLYEAGVSSKRPTGRAMASGSSSIRWQPPQLPLDDAKPQQIQLGEGYRCNNDHDLSRDGKWLAFSASTPSSRQSQVFLSAADGSA